jgi:hypothetical protein
MAEKCVKSVFLLGEICDTWIDAAVPTNAEVLRKYYHHIEGVTRSQQQAFVSGTIADSLMASRLKINAPTKPKRAIVANVKRLVNDHRYQLKNRTKHNQASVKSREKFQRILNSPFEAAPHGTADEESKRLFTQVVCDLNVGGLELSGTCASLGHINTSKNKRKRRRCDAKDQYGHVVVERQIGAANDRQNNQKRRKLIAYEGAVDVDHQQFQRRFYQDVHGRPRNVLQTVVSSPKVLSVMDRLNMSDNQGVMMIGAVADAMGIDVADSTLSRSTIKRCRETHRVANVAKIKAETSWKDSPLVIHWDGKKLPDATNSVNSKSKIERHGVSVTGIYELNL